MADGLERGGEDVPCLGREKLLLFFISSIVSCNFSYSLFPFSGGIATDGNSAVTRHGCRIDGDPSLARYSIQTVRKIHLTIPLIKNKRSFSRPRHGTSSPPRSNPSAK